jgi:hypothetical protein
MPFSSSEPADRCIACHTLLLMSSTPSIFSKAFRGFLP